MEYERLEKSKILSKLFWFAVPLIIGNVVMMSYDLVDALVISKFVGEVGLGAVSNAGQITTLVLLLYYGLCMGASVIISEYYGAREMQGLKYEVSTIFIAGSIFAIIVSALFYIFAQNLFKLMQVPEEALSDTISYLRIGCYGLPFVFVYNVFANAMKAMGNSKVPTFFLGLSAVINMVFDLLFVASFKWGVGGASLATVIAQISTCIITYIYVQVTTPELRLGKGDFVVKRRLLIRTFKDGSITALQQAVPSIGRTLVLAKINTLGVIAMAANGIIGRVDTFAIVPSQNVGLGIMTYTAQARGAKQNDIINDIFKKGAMLEMCCGAIIFSLLFILKDSIMIGLSPKESFEVIAMGGEYLKIMSFGYILVAIVNTYQCFFRGMGNMSITLYSSLIIVFVKVIFTYNFADRWGLNAVAWGTIIGWILMNIYATFMKWHYDKTKWKDVLIYRRES